LISRGDQGKRPAVDREGIDSHLQLLEKRRRFGLQHL